MDLEEFNFKQTSGVWLEVTVFGFVYLVAAFFLFLTCLGRHDLAFFEGVDDYLPYLSVAVVIF